MKAGKILVAVMAVLPFAAHAFDYGMDILDSSMYLSDGTTFVQQNRATPWFSQPFGDNANLYLSGFYEFKGSFASAGTTVTPWRFDAGRSEFTGSAAGALGPRTVLRWSIGRTAMSDFSGWVLSGLYDGLHLELSVGNLTMATSVAYTGLLDKNDALLAIDSNDLLVSGDSTRYFAPRRLLGGFGLRSVELLPGHDFGFETWGQYDLEQGMSGTQSAWLEPFVEGRFGRNLSWRGWAAGEALYDGSATYSLAGGLLVRLVVPEALGLRTTGSIAWSSGSAFGLVPFVPFKSNSLDALTGFTFENIMSPALDISLSPFSWLSPTLHGAAMLRTSDLVIGSTAVRPDATGVYMGTLVTLQASIRTVSDLILNLSGGIFIPNTVDYFKADQTLKETGSVYAVFSL